MLQPLISLGADLDIAYEREGACEEVSDDEAAPTIQH